MDPTQPLTNSVPWEHHSSSLSLKFICNMEIMIPALPHSKDFERFKGDGICEISLKSMGSQTIHNFVKNPIGG